MKWFLSFLYLLVLPTLFAQKKIEVVEQSQQFHSGSKNSIVVTIPHGILEVVNKVLQKELKSWNGKLNNSNKEYFLEQGSKKSMGEKAFDVYSKIMQIDDETIRVAFAVDLGGANLSSQAHSSQYDAMRSEVKKFAIEAAEKSISFELDTEKKVLNEMQKKYRKLENKKKSDLASIGKYQKKISDAEKRIEENTVIQIKTKEEIDEQMANIKAVEKKKKDIR